MLTLLQKLEVIVFPSRKGFEVRGTSGEEIRISHGVQDNCQA